MLYIGCGDEHFQKKWLVVAGPNIRTFCSVLKLHRSPTEPQIVNVLIMYIQNEAKTNTMAAHYTRIKVRNTSKGSRHHRVALRETIPMKGIRLSH